MEWFKGASSGFRQKRDQRTTPGDRALLFFGVFLLSVSSDAQTGSDSTGAAPAPAPKAAPTPTPASAKSADAQAQAGGASAESSRDRQRRNVMPKTTPRRPLPPTGGPPVSVMAAGLVLTGAGLLGACLMVRRG